MADADRLAALEEDTKARLQRLRAAAESAAPAAETQTLSASSQSAIARQQQLKETVERRKRARELAVPTNDNAVKLQLREHDQPICIFGEGAPERRERLRDVMAENLDLDAPYEAARGAEVQKQAKRPTATSARATEADDQKELFYTEGSEELKAARLWISRDSLARAATRLQTERERITQECTDVTADAAAHSTLNSSLKNVQNQLSNFGDERPISMVAFAPGSSVIATGSWSSLVKLWSLPDCRCVATLKGHTERISGLAWHPAATSAAHSPTAVNLVSSSCDSTAKLWPLEGGKPLGELTGHVGRLSRVAFHPSGRFVGTAGFDTTWRLWDVERCTELLLQEGHARSLYAICFHPDGSLVATSGLDSIVRLWDVRSGRAVGTFQGHVKQVLGLDFSPSGTQLASGSDDHSVRLWDLRKKKCAYTLPAHSSLISHVRYEPGAGRYLLSTSYDNRAKLWSMRDYSLLRTMEGHEGRIMCGDIADDGKHFATAAMDRTCAPPLALCRLAPPALRRLAPPVPRRPAPPRATSRHLAAPGRAASCQRPAYSGAACHSSRARGTPSRTPPRPFGAHHSQSDAPRLSCHQSAWQVEALGLSRRWQAVHWVGRLRARMLLSMWQSRRGTAHSLRITQWDSTSRSGVMC